MWAYYAGVFNIFFSVKTGNLDLCNFLIINVGDDFNFLRRLQLSHSGLMIRLPPWGAENWANHTAHGTTVCKERPRWLLVSFFSGSGLPRRSRSPAGLSRPLALLARSLSLPAGKGGGCAVSFTEVPDTGACSLIELLVFVVMNEAGQMTSRDHWAEDQTLPLSRWEHIYDFAALGSSTHDNVGPVESELLPIGDLYPVPAGKQRFVKEQPKQDLWEQNPWQPVWKFLFSSAICWLQISNSTHLKY